MAEKSFQFWNLSETAEHSYHRYTLYHKTKVNRFERNNSLASNESNTTSYDTDYSNWTEFKEIPIMSGKQIK